MSATLTIIDDACLKRSCCSQLSIDTMECIVTSVPIYTANDKYPAAIHTSNRVHTTSIQHTQ